MSVELATAYVQIIPTTRGIQGNLSRQLTGPLGRAGDEGGRTAGRRYASNFAKIAGGGIAVGLAAVFKTGFDEAKDASAGTAQLQAGIKSTGNAANVSVKGLNDLASSIQGYSGQTDDSIVKAEQLLLTFTNIKNSGPDKIFDQATAAAADMAAKMGGDASSNAIRLGKALNDPVKGITALSKVGVSFTAAQKAQVEAMVKTGDTVGAQKIILKELSVEFGGAAKAAGKSIPGQMARARRAFEDVSQSIVEALLPAVAAVGGFITNYLIPPFKAVVGFFKSGSITAKVVGAAILGLAAALAIAAAVTKITAIATGIYAVVTGEAAASTALQTLALGIAKARMIALSVATKAMAAVQWLLNAAMSANPIVLVVLAIAALVAGVIIAYKKIGWFRDLVQAAFRVIQTAVGVAVAAVKLILRGMYLFFVGIPLAIARIAVGMWNGIVDAIKGAYTRVKGWLGNITDFFGGIPAKIAAVALGMWDSIGDALRTAYRYTIGPMLDTIAASINVIKDALDSLNPASKGGRTSPSRFGYLHIPFLNASGTEDFPGGWSWVGEKGPELLQLPQHAKIRSNPDSMAMAGSGGTTTINLVVSAKVLASVLADQQLVNARRS